MSLCEDCQSLNSIKNTGNMDLPQVNKDHLAMVLDSYGGLHENYLDLKTGEIIAIEMDDEQYHDSRYVYIEPLYPFEAYTFMEEFIGTIKDSTFKRKLKRTVKGKGAFHRFKKALLEHPRESERWHAFYEKKLEEYADKWLERLRSELQG